MLALITARALPRAAARAVARALATESHPDFAPKAKAAAAAAPGGGAAAPGALATRVAATIASSPVVLFMKGSPAAPQCGFSAQVVRVLAAHGITPHGEDVLKDAALRAGMKDISKWPTFPQVREPRRRRARESGCAERAMLIPPPPPFPRARAQLYVKGEFVGGCDIVTQMHESGELKELLASVPRAPLA